MRILGLIVISLFLAVPAMCEEPAASGVNLVPVLKPGDVSRYIVKVQAAGTTKLPGDEKPLPINNTFNLSISHTLGDTVEDGLMRLSIAADQSSTIVDGQNVALSKDFYPKMTALVDKNGEVKHLFASDTVGMRLPGINYQSLILLFRPYAPAGEIKPGAAWKKTVKLPPDPQSYDLSCKFEVLEEVNGVHTARIRTDVTLVPQAGSGISANGFAVTDFAVDSASLVKSHVEMEVKASRKEQGTTSGTSSSDLPGDLQAKVTIDIIRADLAAVGK